jgi:hypothetical protein
VGKVAKVYIDGCRRFHKREDEKGEKKMIITRKTIVGKIFLRVYRRTKKNRDKKFKKFHN